MQEGFNMDKKLKNQRDGENKQQKEYTFVAMIESQSLKPSTAFGTANFTFPETSIHVFLASVE